MHFKISSAICFSLDQHKILSSGKGVNASAKYINPCEPVQSVQADQMTNFWMGPN